MKRLLLAALLVGSALSAAPATAQFYDDDYDYRPRRYRDYDYRRDYDRRYDYGHRRDYDRGRDDYSPRRRGPEGPRAGQGLGGTCVTPRGPCSQTPARPPGSPCICFVPGSGNTPGTVR